jgi:hypothetical protein
VVPISGGRKKVNQPLRREASFEENGAFPTPFFVEKRLENRGVFRPEKSVFFSLFFIFSLFFEKSPFFAKNRKK